MIISYLGGIDKGADGVLFMPPAPLCSGAGTARYRGIPIPGHPIL